MISQYSTGVRIFKSLLVMGMLVLLICAESPAQETEPASTEGSPEYVSIDFNNVDINVFIKFISRLTGKNFVVDNKIRGNVTIISPTKISIKEAYKVFESVLDIHGFATVEAGNITKIVSTTDARTDNVDTRMLKANENPADKIVTRIVPLQYADAGQLKALLTPLIPKGSVVLAYDDTNMLILTATLSSIDRLVKIIETIDIESTGRKITVLQIKHADASKLVKSLSTIYMAGARTIRNRKNTADAVKFVADERTNSIILLASDLESERITHLVEILDKKIPRGEERIRVYYLEHATAEDLVKVLQEIPTKDNKAQGQKKAPLLSENIKITADKATNSLLIIADKDDYPVLEEVIKKLDIPRAMVYIECLIMEVNANKELNLGTEWRVSEGYNGNSGVVIGGFGATSSDNGYANTGIASGGEKLPHGFSLGVMGKNLSIGGVTFPSLQAVIQAYRFDKDIQILSTPQILTTENEEAVITIGKNVPYQTRSAADAGTETYNSYEYKDVGITLKITPTISQDRLVRLAVYQKVERLDSASEAAGTVRPTTLKRELETTIIVEDANTVVIGGLIDESLSKTVGKTPCLGNIPLLGYAFKSEASGNEKTNLYIFLTPKVVKNPLEAKQIYEKKNEEIQTIEKEEIKLYEDKNTLKGKIFN